MSSFDLITKTRFGPSIYQGSEKAIAEAKKLKEKYVVVSLIGTLTEVFDGHLVPVLAVSIDDAPGKDQMEVIPDDRLVPMLDACVTLIRGGLSIVIHCWAGKHRSTYFDVALHMRLIGLPYKDALSWVMSKHPEAEERKSMREQLTRLEAQLMKGTVTS